MSFTGQPTDATGTHVRNEVELAAAIAMHSDAALGNVVRVSAAGLHQYWTVSTKRFDRWGRFLSGLSTNRAEASSAAHRPRAIAARAWYEEILVSETLTRVWAATTLAFDRHHGLAEADNVVRSVALRHAQLRQQATGLLTDRRGLSPAEAPIVDRLRRCAARWTDLLVAHVQDGMDHCCGGRAGDLCDLAIDPVRAREFADDLTQRRRAQVAGPAAALTLASLRAAFGERLSPVSPNADLNQALARSITACFPPGRFESIGTFESLWTQRLSNQTADVQAMIGELLAIDAPAAI